MSARDYGRRAVYLAEAAVFPDYMVPLPIEQLRKDCARLSPIFGMPVPKIVASQKAKRGFASCGVITFPAKGIGGVPYLIHEMAHLITKGAAQTHGPAFRKNMLRLVELAYGNEQAQRLQNSYAKCGVPVDIDEDRMRRRKEYRPRRKFRTMIVDSKHIVVKTVGGTKVSSSVGQPAREATALDIAVLNDNQRKDLRLYGFIAMSNGHYYREVVSRTSLAK